MFMFKFGMVLALLAASQLPVYSATLSGAVLYGTGPNGNMTLDLWNTLGGDLLFNLYLNDGSSALNTGNGSGARISVDLSTDGVYTFYYAAQPGLTSPTRFALNLFFNGADNNPEISARVPLGSSSFFVGEGLLTPRLDGIPTGAAGTLAFVDGLTTITLTSFEAGTGSDTVRPYADRSGFGSDYAGSFTLQVSTVPEPATTAMAGAGLALLGLWRARRARR